MLGIDLADRHLQIGLGVAGVTLGAALLAKSAYPGNQKGVCCDSGSISSCIDESSDFKSVFFLAYEKFFGSVKAEVNLAPDSLSESAPIEIETEAVRVGDSSQKAFLGRLWTFAKAIVLLPVVIIASILKGFFTGVRSLF